MSKQEKVLIIVGTRPELIKIFPLINYFKSIQFKDFRLVSTGQHKDLLVQYWELFNIEPDYELSIMQPGQNLASLTAKAIVEIQKLIDEIKIDFSPTIIIGQGDTTTVMAASVVAFYNKISYAHVEAGLRSFNLNHPFPEEFNRKVSSVIANYHFVPTVVSKNNLLNEGIPESKIYVTGNTIVDALQYFIITGVLDSHKLDKAFFKGNFKDRVLITCHRRENHAEIESLIEAIEQLAFENKSTQFIWPVHPNPKVYEKVKNSGLTKSPNIIITEPLEYLDLLKVISISKMVLTDSGGIQEEAPTFKVPVLILRETTERPEAVTLGVSKLVGMSKAAIIKGYYDFRPHFGSNFKNPYGDGLASERIVTILGLAG